MSSSAGDIRPSSPWRSAGAVALGVLTVVVLSLATDVVLSLLGVLPPLEQGLKDPALTVLVLAYRCVYNVLGALVTARVAPRSAARNLVVLALIGLALGIAGVVMNARTPMGPMWYPVLLAFSALPCTWIGWRLSAARRRAP